jgi:hypothetical protein
MPPAFGIGFNVGPQISSNSSARCFYRTCVPVLLWSSSLMGRVQWAVMPEATLGNKDPTSLARLLAGGTGAAASSAVASSAAVKSLRAGAEPLRTASNSAYEDTSEPHDLLELQRR